MDGGPSHKDTFDLKPGTDDGGEFKPITDERARHPDQRAFPELRQADEPRRHPARHDHRRRRSRPGQVLHAHRLQGRRQAAWSIPASAPSRPPRSADPRLRRCRTSSPSATAATGPASSAPRHQPLIVNDPARGVENLKPLVDGKQFDNRVGLLEEMEQAFPPRLPGRRRQPITRRPISGPSR